ncbi:MAG: DUF167 family protein [Gammaproteobacteria bacterium]|nr:DUF167 family protein [Gammaproteobacteria bacterium]
MADFFQWQDKDLVLNIKVQPRASKDEFAERLGNAIKLRITAAPVDGKANQHLIALLAKIFKVTKKQVTILSGETGRDKRIKIRQPKQLPDCITKCG